MKERKQVFHIRIGSNAQKLDIKDPAFTRLLEQQYATRYLRNLGVTPNAKNIAHMLKDYPLDNCDIIESRLTGGLHTDTITITMRGSKEGKSQGKDSVKVSQQMLWKLNLRKIQVEEDATRKDTEKYVAQAVPQEGQKDQALQILNMEPRHIKQTYIFPFSYTFQRKKNYEMRDNSVAREYQEDSKVIYQAKIFNFPFTRVRLSLKALKEMQSPIETRLSEVNTFLDKFCAKFPKHMFTEGQSSRYAFKDQEVESGFKVVRSEQMGKLCGVLLHLCYWSVFGAVNPIQIQSSLKSKMYLMMHESLQYFRLRAESSKLWSVFIFPLVLLSLKMLCHYFFALQYPRMFTAEEARKVGADQLALDKIFLFVEKLFDQTNLAGRFVFLESDIKGPKGTASKEKQFIQKRMFGTSPALNLIMQHPKDGKARAIIARNTQIDQSNGTLEEGMLRVEQTDPATKHKLMTLALHKIAKRLQQKMGSSANHIIQLTPE